MTTIQDVKQILLSKKDNLTARRWAKSEHVMREILDSHLAWNEDHTKIKQPDMILPLEVSIDSYLDNPSLVDDKFEPPEY